MSNDERSESEEGISIGLLSELAGIPAATLRNWERRYGFPAPSRRASGHRRYPRALVAHLRRIRRALDAGHAPRRLLPASEEELLALLDSPSPSAPGSATGGEAKVEADGEDGATTAAWLACVRRLDGRGLVLGLRRAQQELGVRRFVEERVVPFLRDLGERWRAGELGIRHEHFASTHLEHFLAAHWRPAAEASEGPCVVAATLPGEEHTLPLHLAALLLTTEGFRFVLLGRDTPPEEILAAAEAVDAAALLVAVSAAAGSAEVHRYLEVLEGGDGGREILVGAPFPLPDLTGITALGSFSALASWAASRRPGPPRPGAS